MSASLADFSHKRGGPKIDVPLFGSAQTVTQD